MSLNIRIKGKYIDRLSDSIDMMCSYYSILSKILISKDCCMDMYC